MGRVTEVVLRPKRRAQSGTTARSRNGAAETSPDEERPRPARSAPVIVLQDDGGRISPAVEPAKRGGTFEQSRDFLFCYDGRFLGHYHAAKRISNRTAFRTVARQLQGTMGSDFEPGKLQIFRPIPLAVDPSISERDLAAGSFRWFDGK